MTPRSAPAPELHRPLSLDRIGSGSEVTVEATPAECAALAPRLGIPALSSLVCRFRLRPGPAGTVLAQGSLEAHLVRDCVLTLEPFETSQVEAFSLRFVPEGFPTGDDADPDAPDDIPYAGATLDLGEAAAEQLALVLDPYPRSPGAVPPEAEGDASASPFAALAALRRPQ